jgi:hypothetical protein
MTFRMVAKPSCHTNNLFRVAYKAPTVRLGNWHPVPNVCSAQEFKDRFGDSYPTESPPSRPMTETLVDLMCNLLPWEAFPLLDVAAAQQE